MNRRPFGFRDYVAEQGFHSVYLVTTVRDAPVKVGIAQDPIRRLGGLQNAHFESLRIYRLLWLPGRPIAARVERSFKMQFAHASIRGEWFDVSLPAAQAFIESSIRSVGTWGISQEDMLKLMEQWEQRRFERAVARITPGACWARSQETRWPVSRLLR